MKYKITLHGPELASLEAAVREDRQKLARDLEEAEGESETEQARRGRVQRFIEFMTPVRKEGQQ